MLGSRVQLVTSWPVNSGPPTLIEGRGRRTFRSRCDVASGDRQALLGADVGGTIDREDTVLGDTGSSSDGVGEECR